MSPLRLCPGALQDAAIIYKIYCNHPGKSIRLNGKGNDKEKLSPTNRFREAIARFLKPEGVQEFRSAGPLGGAYPLQNDGEDDHAQHGDRIVTGAVKERQCLQAIIRSEKTVGGNQEEIQAGNERSPDATQPYTDR
jgi:hypothetical protein